MTYADHKVWLTTHLHWPLSQLSVKLSTSCNEEELFRIYIIDLLSHDKNTKIEVSESGVRHGLY